MNIIYHIYVYFQTRSLSTSGNLFQAQVQKPAPNFTAQAVVNGQFKEVSLSDYKGKYVVVYFYPLDFTFVCPTEIIAFSDRIKEFSDLGCEVRTYYKYIWSMRAYFVYKIYV